MQISGTGRKTDASYHLKKKTTSLVNRQGGFEGVSYYVKFVNGFA